MKRGILFIAKEEDMNPQLGFEHGKQIVQGD